MNLEHKIILMNERGCSILKCDRENLIGKDWFDNFIPELDRETLKERFDSYIKNIDFDYEYHENSVIIRDGSIKVIEGELIESNNTHGSGCTYSSAITSFLVKGDNIENAVKKAGEFTKESIKHGLKGTLNQLYNCY